MKSKQIALLYKCSPISIKQSLLHLLVSHQIFGKLHPPRPFSTISARPSDRNLSSSKLFVCGKSKACKKPHHPFCKPPTHFLLSYLPKVEKTPPGKIIFFLLRSEFVLTPRLFSFAHFSPQQVARGRGGSDGGEFAIFFSFFLLREAGAPDFVKGVQF